MEILVHLGNELFEGQLTELGHLGIEFTYGNLGFLVGFQQQAFHGACQQGCFVEMESEAEVEVVGQ